MERETMLMLGALAAPWLCFLGSAFVAWLESDEWGDKALRCAMTINACLSLPVALAATWVLGPATWEML